jgi:rhodanese-related sulfurtransferase
MMKKLGNYFLIALFGMLVFNFFIKSRPEADAKKSYESYTAGKAVFIDVREEGEVKDGMIKGALWVPLSKIEQDQKAQITKIQEATKGKEIFIYCRSGNRSSKVKTYLEESGTKSVNMGGYSSLVNEGLHTQPGPQ